MEEQQVQRLCQRSMTSKFRKEDGPWWLGRTNKGKRKLSPERPQTQSCPWQVPLQGLKTSAQDPRQVGSCLLSYYEFSDSLRNSFHVPMLCSLAGVTLGLFHACWARFPSNDRGSLRTIFWVLWVFCLSFWPHPTASSPVYQGVANRALWNMQWLLNGLVKDQENYDQGDAWKVQSIISLVQT